MARESRPILLLLGLAVLGHGARLLLQPRAAPPGQLFADTTRPALDPARQRARAERAFRQLGPHEQIDINSATAEEISRLPRIGMSLAKRIVAGRAHGPFRGLKDLDRVPGVGPGLLAALADRLRFGGLGAENPAPEAGGANPRTPGAYAGGSGPDLGGPIDLNSASEADLRSLPGIGQARARTILAYRRENGPFAAVSELGRVPGISQVLLARLAPLLTAR